MPDPLPITGVVFTSSRQRERTRGCLGWIRFTVAGVLRVDGIAVRRASDGQISLAFPSRRAQGGNRHAVVAPTDAEARRAIESQIFAELADVLPKERI